MIIKLSVHCFQCSYIPKQRIALCHSMVPNTKHKHRNCYVKKGIAAHNFASFEFEPFIVKDVFLKLAHTEHKIIKQQKYRNKRREYYYCY